MLAAGLFLPTAAARAAEALTNAAQILSLAATQAAQAFPVRLRGVVVDDSEPRDRAVILQDASASIYLFARTNLFAPFHRQDVLEISGVTSQGEFAPCVRADDVKKSGGGADATARPVNYQQLITGSQDAQFVEISGVVRQCQTPATNVDAFRMLLATDGGPVPVRVSVSQFPLIKEDAEVTVRAVCLYQFNLRRQALNPVLQVPRGVSVQINRPPPAAPFDEPVRPLASLLQYSPGFSLNHRIHVNGVVTRSQPGALVWIRDESSGLRIQVHQGDILQPGDRIDVLGFRSYGASAPVLEDAIFRKTGTMPPPVPLMISNPPDAYDHQDDLVSLDAELTDLQPVLDGLVLNLKQQGTVFKALLKQPFVHSAAWQPGSRVRVAGICDVTYDSARPVMGVWHPQSFQVLLRSTDDLTVLKSPPWWTAQHITLLLGIFAGGLLVVSGAVMLLARRRLNEQARRRAMAEAEFAAILSERNRLAREIHDTLAQGLTATAVQLQLVKIHAKEVSATTVQHLDLAQKMVRESLEEARNSIWNMRPQVLETGDLADALKNILQSLAEGVVAETRFEVAGRPRRLPAVIENNVLRLGQEAITNAVKHSRARSIRVKLEFAEHFFAFTVADDGGGFDPARPPRSDGGFGLVGMHERAKELNGTLKIVSAAGQGTEINLFIPLLGE